MKVLKCGSEASSEVALSDSFVDGTFRSPSASLVSAAEVSVDMYLTSSHDSAACLTPLGMPMMVPPTWPGAVQVGRSSAVGGGAVA